jgi:hypothetical protein
MALVITALLVMTLGISTFCMEFCDAECSQGILKGGSINVPLTSSLTGLD